MHKHYILLQSMAILLVASIVITLKEGEDTKHKHQCTLHLLSEGLVRGCSQRAQSHNVLLLLGILVAISLHAHDILRINQKRG